MHLLRRAIQQVQKRCFIDRGDYRRTVLLAGTGRSGTTWVEHVLNFDNSYRLMFEPFHSREVALLREWKYRQYLRPDDVDEKYLAPATQILSGTIRHAWIDRDNRRFFARARLIKEIRAMLLLKWIKRNFPEIPQILLLRHPCAVAHSRLQLNWDTHLDVFLEQPDLVSDFLTPFLDLIRSAADPFEKHVLTWCIENHVPLRQFVKGEALVVFYEHLCLDPEPEIRRIMTFLGRPFSEAMMGDLPRPSALSRSDSPIRTGGDLVDSWRGGVSQRQISRARELCAPFGLDALYGDQSVPLIRAESVLQGLGLGE